MSITKQIKKIVFKVEASAKHVKFWQTKRYAKNLWKFPNVDPKTNFVVLFKYEKPSSDLSKLLFMLGVKSLITFKYNEEKCIAAYFLLNEESLPVKK